MAGDARGTVRRSRTKTRTHRVYVEAGVTVSVTDEPPQFVRYTFGMEVTAPDGSAESLEKIEEETYEKVERIVDRRVRKLARLVKARSAGAR